MTDRLSVNPKSINPRHQVAGPDFAQINKAALNSFPGLLKVLFPGGRAQGSEFVCGDLSGKSGRSLSVNLDKGVWKDFSTEQGGSDPVSLWAAAHGCSQIEAARLLATQLGLPDAAKGQRSVCAPRHAAKQTLSTDKVPDKIFHPTLGQPAAFWVYHDQQGRVLGLVCRWDHPGGEKTIRPYTPSRNANGDIAWQWKGWPEPRPLYGLDRLAAHPDAPVLVTEGEKAADAAQKLFPGMVAITWPHGAESAGKADFSPLRSRTVHVWPDADEPGHRAARAACDAATAVGAVEVLKVAPPEGVTSGWDLADALAEGWTPERAATWLQANSTRLANTLEESEQPESSASKDSTPEGDLNEAAEQAAFDREVERLADLPVHVYERQRKEAAKALGIRAAILDSLVQNLRKGIDLGSDLPFDTVTPWPEPVHPAQVLDTIATTTRRFIVCAPEVANTVALWAAMTWFMDSVHVAPLALITAPEKRCGKTQLLTILSRLTARAVAVSSISPAALYRTIQAWNPALMIDEADAFMRENEELRGIINSGHTRDTAFVIRTTGDDHTPTRFSTWGAKAIAGIGRLADTLMDRSIILGLRRKLPTEQVERLRYAEPSLFPNLRSMLARFAEDCQEEVRLARPDLPESLNDRQQDNWEPLLAIAQVVGGDWPDKALKAALKLSGSESMAQTIGTELLTDIRTIFENRDIDRIKTVDLIEALCDDSEAPWCTYNRGKPISDRQIASHLREYGIKSRNVRINGDVPKGYLLADFTDTFSRYTPVTPFPSATTLQSSNNSKLDDKMAATQGVAVADKNQCNLLNLHECSAVADKNPLPDGESKKQGSVADKFKQTHFVEEGIL